MKLNITPMIGIIVAGLIFLMSGCKDSPEPEVQIRPVRTTEVRTAPPSIERRFAGTTNSVSKTELSFRVAGRIDKFPSKVGSELKAGEIIAKIDDSDLRLQLDKSKAVYSQAKTQMLANKSRYQRLTSLHNQQAISDMEFEKVKADYEKSVAEVTQAKKMVQLDKQQVSYATLTTPVDGCMLNKSYVTKNENVESGQAIASISCGNKIEVTAVIPESIINSITIGQKVQAIIKSADQAALSATITEIGLSSSTSGLYFVNAQLSDVSNEIRDGMAAELIIVKSFDSYSGSLWIPMVAVLEEQGGHFAMTFDKKDNKIGMVVRKEIKVGRFVHGYFEVTEGLAEGQQVITAGLNQIFDGLEVKILPEGQL